MKTRKNGWVWIALSAAWIGLVASADSTPLTAEARSVHAIFQARCYRCHGQNGEQNGGMDSILDLHSLIDLGKVIPGNATASPLWQAVDAGQMPPRATKIVLSVAEKNTLRTWIDSGAVIEPGVAASTLSETEVLERISRDVDEVAGRNSGALAFLRYFTFQHLRNQGATPDKMKDFAGSLALLVNSLSWNAKITRPTPVGTDGLVYRVDIRDYDWSASQWDFLTTLYPYSSRQPRARELGEKLSARIGTRYPVVKADWFGFFAARPPFYHSLAKIPNAMPKLQSLLQIDVSENLARTTSGSGGPTAARLGFLGYPYDSGVSLHNRVLERHANPDGRGALWISYDFKNQDDLRNIFSFPLGPFGPHGFTNDGGEIIFNLPNGLQAYLLVKAAGRTGVRIDEAPTQIVYDQKRNAAVTNGISCMSCHAEGIIPKNDKIRPAFLQKRDAEVSGDLREQVLRLYPGDVEMAKYFQTDRATFAAAKQLAMGFEDRPNPLTALSDWYDQNVDLKRAAAELDETEADLVREINEAVGKHPFLRNLSQLKSKAVARNDFLALLLRFRPRD